MSLQYLHQLFLDGRFEECLRGCDTLQRNIGTSGQLAYLRAYALLRLNRTEEAIQGFLECLKLGIKSPDVFRNILSGNLALLRNIPECLVEARALWQADPSNELNLSNLMLALLLNQREADFNALLSSVRSGLTVNQKSYALLIASKFKSARGDHVGELNLLQESLRLTPDNPQVLEALAIHYRDVCNDYPSSIKIFSGLADQGSAEALAELSHSRLRACDWSNYLADLSSLGTRENVGTCKAVCNPIVMLAHTLDPEMQDSYGKIFCASTYGALDRNRDMVPPKAGNALRKIAFLSSDFRDHPIGYLVEDFFAKLLNHVEITALSCSAVPLDRQTDRLKQNLTHFEDISTWSLSERVGYIRANDFDLLIDLNGLTKGLDYKLISQIRRDRCCPVYSWLGYPGPMPRGMFDKIILDSMLQVGIPERDWEGYIFLEHCYQPNNFHRYAKFRTSKVDRESSVLELVVTSNAFKIRPDIFDVWCRVLNRFSNTRISVLCDSEHIKDNLTREFRTRGVRNRFNFWGRVDHEAHMNRLAAADLVLDTYPYSNHTGTSDALSVGTPLVTIMGDTVASRVCGTILKRVGLDSLVGDDLSEYEEIICQFISDDFFRGKISKIMAEEIQYSPVFDMHKLAKEFIARLHLGV